MACTKSITNAHFAPFCTTRQFLHGHSSIPQRSFARTAKIRSFWDILPSRVTGKQCKSCVIFSLLSCRFIAMLWWWNSQFWPQQRLATNIGRPSKQLMRLDAVLQQCARAHREDSIVVLCPCWFSSWIGDLPHTLGCSPDFSQQQWQVKVYRDPRWKWTPPGTLLLEVIYWLCLFFLDLVDLPSSWFSSFPAPNFVECYLSICLGLISSGRLQGSMTSQHDNLCGNLEYWGADILWHILTYAMTDMRWLIWYDIHTDIWSRALWSPTIPEMHSCVSRVKIARRTLKDVVRCAIPLKNQGLQTRFIGFAPKKQQ